MQTFTNPWNPISPGIWQCTVGSPGPFTPLAVVQAGPLESALADLGQGPVPFPVDALRVESFPGRLIAAIPIQAGEQFYGLGLQMLGFAQRGLSRTLRVNSDPRIDTGETHAPVPFFVSSRGYGLLVNTARVITIHLGSCKRVNPQDPAGPPLEMVEILLPAEGAEIFAFAGPTLLDVVRRYNLFCGGGALPPRWGLGFWHRVHLSYTDRQAMADARAYAEHDLPLDVLGLEPGWQTHSYPSSFEWNPEHFPDPAGFIAAAGALGLRVNLWEHAYVSPHARLFPALLPYSGSHTTMGGLVPDYSLPEARRILQEHHERTHLSLGVAGYKLDECDGGDLVSPPWTFPAHASYPSGIDGEQIRQMYGLMLQKLTWEMFRKAGRRTWGLVRASHAGSASLPYVLYSDLYDHRQYVRALCASSFSGLLWTPEVRGAGSAEEWVRRIQVVCFSPLAQLDAWSTSTMPWSFPEVEAIARKFLKLRMRLMPYFYSAFARYHFDGTPPFRAMALEPGVGEGQILAADDQYMAGDSLLVAPVFAGETSRLVHLPEGRWFDFETGEAYEGGQSLRVFPGLEKLPLFVRDGGIIPLMPALPHAPGAGQAVPLEVRCYGRAPGSFRLFDDDGETLAYDSGGSRWIALKTETASNGERRGFASRPEDGWRSSYGEIAWKFM